MKNIMLSQEFLNTRAYKLFCIIRPYFKKLVSSGGYSCYKVGYDAQYLDLVLEEVNYTVTTAVVLEQGEIL